MNPTNVVLLSMLSFFGLCMMRLHGLINWEFSTIALPLTFAGGVVVRYMMDQNKEMKRYDRN